MIKLFLKSCLLVAFLLSAVAQATLITTPPVAETETQLGNYITYNGVDIAWASNVNSERWYLSLSDYNTLLAPTTHTGWDFATTEQWDMITTLTGSELLALFTRASDGSYIQAFEYWNTYYAADSDGSNVLNGKIASHWSWSVPIGEDTANLTDDQKIAQIGTIDLIGTSFYDTFYFRASQADDAKPVPEPSTLLIFALGLITLATRKKLVK